MEPLEPRSAEQYLRVAKATEFIKKHYKSQPSLDEIAKHVHLSPHRFHRLFSDWAGTTPEKFLQYISIRHAKQVLEKNGQVGLFDATENSGLSGTSRRHDHFITIVGMSPAEYRDGGKNLSISYSFSPGPFGEMLVASTAKGVCRLVFTKNREVSLGELINRFPKARFIEQRDKLQRRALTIFEDGPTPLSSIKLHLKGTDFQMNVWQALLKIPQGDLSTYGRVASAIDNPNSSRAVGSAIGRNPAAYLIPCHRVIHSTGNTGGYMWGSTRKTVIIGWEAVKR